MPPVKFCHCGHLELKRLFDTVETRRRDLLQGFWEGGACNGMYSQCRWDEWASRCRLTEMSNSQQPFSFTSFPEKPTGNIAPRVFVLFKIYLNVNVWGHQPGSLSICSALLQPHSFSNPQITATFFNSMCEQIHTGCKNLLRINSLSCVCFFDYWKLNAVVVLQVAFDLRPQNI